MGNDDLVEFNGELISNEEYLLRLLNESIKIIMHEWGYTRDQTTEWLKRKAIGED